MIGEVVLDDGNTAILQSGAGAPVGVRCGGMLSVQVYMQSATPATSLVVWLQGEGEDNEWFDLVADFVTRWTGTEAQGTLQDNARDIYNGDPTTGEMASAQYDFIPCHRVRAAYGNIDSAIRIKVWGFAK